MMATVWFEAISAVHVLCFFIFMRAVLSAAKAGSRIFSMSIKKTFERCDDRMKRFHPTHPAKRHRVNRILLLL